MRSYATNMSGFRYCNRFSTLLLMQKEDVLLFCDSDHFQFTKYKLESISSPNLFHLKSSADHLEIIA